MLPAEERVRERLRARVAGLFDAAGFEPVQTPVLERYRAGATLADEALKLVDADGGILALRADHTAAVARLVTERFPDGPWPLRLRYWGLLYRGGEALLGRLREFEQAGVEILGASNAALDAELIGLALDVLAAIAPDARLELGQPAFARAVLEATGAGPSELESLRQALDRKSAADLALLLEPLRPRAAVRKAVLALPDLYGGAETLRAAERCAIDPRAARALERLAQLWRKLSSRADADRLLVDLGMAKAFSYYSGPTFRAYTREYGQSVLSGGRYDGALGRGPAGRAAGFAVYIDRLVAAGGGEESPG